MDEKITELSANGSVPEVEVTIGQAQFGKYELYLWDSNGQNPVKIGEGLNTEPPHPFPIGGPPVQALDGKILTWQCIVSALSTDPNQHYAATVTIRQGGNIAPDSPYVQAGPLNGTEIVHDFTRFKVQ
jgi:hypothetical protein